MNNDAEDAKIQLETLQRLYGKDIAKLKKHDRFRQAMEIFRDVIASGTAANIAYTYGPRAFEYASNVINGVIDYGGNVVEAVNYLSDPMNYVVSVTEDDYMPIGEDAEEFALDLESGESAVSIPESITDSMTTGEEASGFFENVFENGWSSIVNGVDSMGGYGSAISDGYAADGVVGAIEAGIEGAGAVAEGMIGAIEGAEGVAEVMEILPFFFL
jgi:hypothetical protein